MSGPYGYAWQRRRAEQLRRHPLCELCMRVEARVTAATVADHVVPHRGDSALFAGPLQSLCKRCHDSRKKALELTGHFRGCDLHGMPLDPGHPWNTEPDPAVEAGGGVRKACGKPF